MPDLGRQNSRAVTIRLPDRLYNHLVAQAGFNDCSLAQAMRLVLERDVEGQPDIPIEGNAPGDSGLPYATFLERADFTEAIAELQARDDAEA